MKNILGFFIIILSIIGGLYIGGWLLFIKPIIDACKAFDTDTLTAVIIGVTLIKCLFASTVGSLIVYIGVHFGCSLME